MKGKRGEIHGREMRMRESRRVKRGHISPHRVVFWDDPRVISIYHRVDRIPQFRSLRKLEKAVIGRRV